MITKVCTVCGIEKELDKFHNAKNGKFGKNSKCKECIKIECKKSYIERKFKLKEYATKNKDRIKLNRKIWYEKNKESILLKSKEKYQNEKEVIKLKTKEYYKNNKEKCYKRNMKWKEKNINHVRKTLNEWHRKKIISDSEFKMRITLRNQFRRVLRKYKITKQNSYIDLLGCDMDYFMKHIENQFTPEMSWENHGRDVWEIDHIKPCVLFNLSDIEEQKKCFHYTNLRPLDCKTNRSLGGKLKKNN